jgi:LPXTG-site transpeptidase (sortase) family protein
LPGNRRLAKGQVVRVAVPESPLQTSAAVVTVTAVNSGGAGYVSAYPTGTAAPVNSTVNMDRVGHTVANLATVRLGGDRSLSLFTSVDTDIILDLVGVYEPVQTATAGRFVPIVPTRVHDSRSGAGPLHPGGRRRVSIPGVPGDAVAVLNVTAISAPAGYWTVWPAGSAQPKTSNLNVSRRGETIANQVMTPVGPGGVDVFSETGGDLLVDVVGYMTGASAPTSAAGLFVPITPYRVVDTRQAGLLNPSGDRLKPRTGWTIDAVLAGRPGIPTIPPAASLNVTFVGTNSAGYATVFAAGTERPAISSLNAASRNQTVANHVIARSSQRGVSIYTSTSAHVLVDVTGWFTGDIIMGTLPPAHNPLDPSDGRLRIPAIGIDQTMRDGVTDVTLDKGPMHWSLSVLPGDIGTTMLLGHRWSHTAPFYRLAELETGDEIIVDDQRGRFVYRVTKMAVVDPDTVPELSEDGTANVLLVACHPIGSVSQRIVIRGELVQPDEVL